MIRLAWIVVVLASSHGVQAQQVMASAGGHGSGAGLQVAWTIGESIIATGTSANIIATQGFHQPPADLTTVIIPPVTNADWQLFPNPTRGTLHLSTSALEADHAQVINAFGQRVAIWPIIASTGAWDVNTLAGGSYRLRVFDHDANLLQTLSFIVVQ